MNNQGALKLVGIVLIVAGTAALAYGKFSYTKETHDVDLGVVEFEIEERETVNIPVWAGVAGIIGGTLLLLLSAGKRS